MGGAAAFVLARIGWAWAVPFVDPVLVLIACALLVSTPLGPLRSGLGEILEAAPPAHIQAVSDEAVAEVRSTFDLGEPFVSATKMGERLYVDARFLVEESRSVGREDEVRRLFIRRPAGSNLEVSANLELTADETLAH